MLDETSISLEQIVISELRDATFYAELHLTDGETNWIVSSRPSDAIALAARMDCPIYVDEEVLDEAGVAQVVQAEPEEVADGDPEEVVEEFRQFIDTVNPEDFGS